MPALTKVHHPERRRLAAEAVLLDQPFPCLQPVSGREAVIEEDGTAWFACRRSGPVMLIGDQYVPRAPTGPFVEIEEAVYLQVLQLAQSGYERQMISGQLPVSHWDWEHNLQHEGVFLGRLRCAGLTTRCLQLPNPELLSIYRRRPDGC
jgi:hypothetical protein